MNRTKQHIDCPRRRGTVLVLVVGILALLFIIGATSLMLMRFERQNVYTHATVRNLDAVATALMNPVVAQLRKDIVGDDGIPYNRGWGGDTSPLEDYADFAGFASGKGIRNGDLLLSSNEPYYDGDQRQYRWPYLSWGYDAVLTGGTAPAEGLISGQKLYTTGGPRLDVSGDGLRDGIESSVFAGLSAMFGGNYQTLVRVIPHGGMVLLDPYTHPALLTQVIHPLDSAYFSDPAGFWTQLTTDPLTDESNLRRRYFLPPLLEKPGDGQTYADIAPTMVRLLPVTLGYADPSKPADWVNAPIEHWWPIDDTLVAGDAEWWVKRLTPPTAMTDTVSTPAYNAESDWYDRRHLITTLNSDDVLRRIRGEKLIEDTNGDGTVDANDVLAPFYYILNPTDTSNLFAYGVVNSGTELAFNGPGLRTQFSLRDVLEPNGEGSYRRAMQLTAYYLAMIQGTSVPGSAKPTGEARTAAEVLDQLRTAAQLAVNTIDFADQDLLPSGRPMPSYFAWPDTATPSVQVVGVERQPYLTEAYARLVYKSDALGDKWELSSVAAESIYAIELYNPYDTPIDLQDFEIWIGPTFTKGFPDDATEAKTAQVTFAAGTTIGAYSYLVISNKGAAELNITTDEHRKIQSAVTAPKISHGDNVALMRNKVKNLTTGSEENKYVMVDLLRPVGLGADNNYWAYPGPDQTALDAYPRQPSGPTDKLVWDSSLQRHKEPAGTPTDPRIMPRYWHFTLARQWLFPLRLDVPDGGGLGATQMAFCGAPWQFTDPTQAPGEKLTDTTSRPMQHSLFGTGPNTATGSPNQIFVERDSLGLPVVLSFPNPNSSGAPDPVVPPVQTQDKPLAAFPVLCSDDPPNGIAFPTTGTLLLVTRYAHTPDGPVSVAATKGAHDTNRLGTTALNIEQMEKLDNGHLPIFDTSQKCADFNDGHGRCDFPWGQLVFDYFTALPLEQLTWPLENLGVAGYPAGTRMIDLTSEAEYDQVYATAFPRYPIISRVAASASLGAKVRGRININAAPWWVLDGLPMLWEPVAPRLPTDPIDSDHPDELPARELHSSFLDPAELASEIEPEYRPAEYMMHLLVDDATATTAAPPRNWTTASPIFAKTMVAHRERRKVYGPTGSLEVDLKGGTPDSPGFVSVGGLCNMVSRVGLLKAMFREAGTGAAISLSEPGPLTALREYIHPETATDGNTQQRPFGYIGYLQLVAPVVRLQDWVTTRNHAFTIYGSISTTTDPAIHLRMQTTVDRSPCLYGGTATTIVTEPTGYYNALED